MLVLLSFIVKIVWAILAAELNACNGVVLLFVVQYSIAHLSPPTHSSLALPAGSLVIILDTLVTCQVGVDVTAPDECWVICMDYRMFVVVEMPTICKKLSL
jgi:hypothetical protein